MKSFYVIHQDYNAKEFEPYDVMHYLVEQYKKVKNKPKTKDEFIEFIKAESRYKWWSRCEYEIIIAGWPNENTREKWDIHEQVMMNIDIIADILIENV